MLIETDFEQVPFVAVPRHVVRLVGHMVDLGGGVSRPFSAEALGVLVWLAARPPRAQVGVGYLRAVMGWGEDKWRRVRQELVAVGALVSAPTRDASSGRVVGSGFKVRWPAADTGKTPASVAGSPTPGKPGPRKPGLSGGKDRGNPGPSYKGIESAPEAAPLSSGGAASGAGAEERSDGAGCAVDAGEAATASVAAPHPLAVLPADAAAIEVVTLMPPLDRAEWLETLGRDVAMQIAQRLPPAGWGALHGFALARVVELVDGRWPTWAFGDR